MCKLILKKKEEKFTPARNVSTADHIFPWSEPNKAAGSVGEQKPSERAVNFSVYAIITAANEAPDLALTTP